MRIRRRPALLFCPTLPHHPTSSSPDLSKASEETGDDHGGSRGNERREEDLHSVGDTKLEAIGASRGSNPKCNERALFPSWDAKGDLDEVFFYSSAASSPATVLEKELPKMKESLIYQPSVNGSKSSSAPPPSPEKKRDKANIPGNASIEKNTDSNGGKEEGRKKRRSPPVLMEGSRCSRMNGRGWRCCQQTLVGYSLCEHHLGKGRLRSVSAVKGPLGRRKAGEPIAGEKSPAKLETSNGVDSDDGMKKKVRKKIGMVKARSLSSLLDECKSISVTSPEIPMQPPPPPLLRRRSDIEEGV